MPLGHQVNGTRRWNRSFVCGERRLESSKSGQTSYRNMAFQEFQGIRSAVLM